MPHPVADAWAWQLHGACRVVDIELFFNPDGECGRARAERDAAAIVVCHRCPVPGARALRSFADSEVDLEINLKDRNGAGQQVTLECWIRRTSRLHLVATSSAAELATAINEVRTELIRQVDDAKTRTEPRSNRVLRNPQNPPEQEQPEM